MQKEGASPDDPVEPTTSVNEVPPHWRFRRVEIPVSHQVTAIAPFDFDGDGRRDFALVTADGPLCQGSCRLG